MTTGFTVRAAKPEEAITIIKDWSIVQKWNPGFLDAIIIQKLYPNGILVGELDGKIISCIIAVPFGDLGYFGVYIVDSEYRGKGYGITTWNQALSNLKDCNIALDAVLDKVELYKKSGFVVPDFLNKRYQGKFDTTEVYKSNESIVPLSKISNEEIAEYERSVNGFYRPEIWEEWKNYEGGHSFAYVQDSKLVGFGQIRPGVDSYKIGPIYAKDSQAAQEIAINLIHSIPKDSLVQLDVCSKNTKAMKLAEEFLKFGFVFELQRMWQRDPPKTDYDQYFASLSIEFA